MYPGCSCQALRTSLVVILHISTIVEANASQLGAGCILVQTALFSHCLLWEPLDSELQVLDYLLQYEVARITTLEELSLITCLEVRLIPRHITEIGSLSNSFVSKLDTVSFITGYGLNTILSNIFAAYLFADSGVLNICHCSPGAIFYGQF